MQAKTKQFNNQITYEQMRKSRYNYSKNVKFGTEDKCFDEKTKQLI